MLDAEQVLPGSARPVPLFENVACIVARHKGQAISAQQFSAHAAQVAATLPERRYLMNTCSDRYSFAVGLAAAMLRGQVSLLPSSTAPQLLRELAVQYAGLYALTDDVTVDLSIERLLMADWTPATTAPILAFAEHQVAAIAFTSGSSGRPAPHAKTWGGLLRGARTAADEFGIGAASDLTILATVPAQHMYGLEFSVILPLCSGIALHSARPFYPEDVRAALAEVGGERMLVTTPIHLRALIESGIRLPALRLIACATAPLSAQLAQQVERRFATHVHEIYGFTEAGQIAMRRTVNDPYWKLLPGIRMQARDGCAWVQGGSVEHEVASSDQIEMIDDRRFALHGRSADMVNIGGKRNSLGYLSQQLCALDGVRDAVVFFPADNDSDVSRPAALVVAPAMTRVQVLDALRQRIDAVFLPRPLHVVEALPRDATGKLPRAALLRLLEQFEAASIMDCLHQYD